MSQSKKNKNKAVALKYNSETDNAPIVIASGYGKTADRIIDVAEKSGIPVFRDDSAASMLCMLEVGSNIPPELYEVVAAIYCQLLKTASEIKGTSDTSDAKAAAAKEKIRLIRESRKEAQKNEKG